MEHFVIPDTQCRPGLSYEHLQAAGNYIVAKQPDKIIHLGDHWDMYSLNTYDRGMLRHQGAAYMSDIDAGRDGMRALLNPIIEYNAKRKRNGKKQYKPEMHFCLGNHEQRIERYVQEHPELAEFMCYEDLEIEKWGWTVHEYLTPVVLDGVHYAHYFYNPWPTPVSRTLASLLLWVTSKAKTKQNAISATDRFTGV